MYSCKRFKAYELVPKKLYELRGEKAIQLLDKELLIALANNWGLLQLITGCGEKPRFGGVSFCKCLIVVMLHLLNITTRRRKLCSMIKKPLHRGFSFCSIPSAGLAPLGQASPRLVSGTRTPGVLSA